jgi:hypothetical protein
MEAEPIDVIAVTSDESQEVLMWRIRALWEASKYLPIEMIPLDYFAHLLDEPQPDWCAGDAPTLRDFARHAKRIYEADLSRHHFRGRLPAGRQTPISQGGAARHEGGRGSSLQAESRARLAQAEVIVIYASINCARQPVSTCPKPLFTSNSHFLHNCRTRTL